MNLKLKRLVRTNTSEQYALFDLDQSDQDDQPLTIGKVDLHYTNEGVYGTLLLWDESTRQLRPAQRRAFVEAILGEITQPMGVPNEFVVEFFMPLLNDYELFHNVGVDEEEDDVDDELADDDNDSQRAGDDRGDNQLDDDELEESVVGESVAGENVGHGKDPTGRQGRVAADGSTAEETASRTGRADHSAPPDSSVQSRQR